MKTRFLLVLALVPKLAAAQSATPRTTALTVGPSNDVIPNPSSVAFAYPNGNQLQAVSVMGVALYSATATTTGGNGWLILSAGSQTGIQVANVPAGTQLTLFLGAPAAMLSTGDYTGMVTVSDASNPSSNATISVTLSVNGSGAPGALSIVPSQPLMFQSTPSAVTPSHVMVSVSAAMPTLFSVVTPTRWVNVPSGTYYTPQSFPVMLTPGTLASGVYIGEIDVASNATFIWQRVPVSLTVVGETNTGNVTADKSMLSFTAVSGGQAQSSVINVSSSGAPVSFTVAVSAQGAGTWLTSDTTRASTTPKAVTIKADPTTLVPGTYQGTVTITASNTVMIPIMFTVQASPTVSADKTNLTFTDVAGGSAPAAQTVLISGSTGGFTATVASDTGNWLGVSPASGTAGTSISVSVDATGIAIGPHMGTVTIAGTNGLTGQSVINVSLTITAALPSVSSVGNGASYAQGTAAPGEVITLFGSNLGPATAVTTRLDANGNLATQLGGVQVLVSGVPAPMIYASATQVSAVAPYELAGFSVAAVGVKYLDQTSNIVTLPVVATVPGIFTQNQSGTGPVGYNGDFSLNGPNNPAPKGSTMVFYVTGEGQTNPPGKTGTINSTPNMNPMPIAGITVMIDGQPTTYSYAGGIEGVVGGIMQLNVQVPASARSGTVPVVVTIGGNSTQNGVTVSVQ